jgi:uncharacterized protein involved in outer membrane biogenesis
MRLWPSARPWAPHPRTLKLAGIVAGVVVLVVLLVLAFMDWNALRGPVARIASVRLRHPVRIDGNLEVHLLSLEPTVSIGGLDIGNPAWAGGGSMAHAERLVVRVKLLHLFKGTAILPLVRIERPVLHLVRTYDGRVNWSLHRGAPRYGRAPNLPVIQRLEMDPGEVTFSDAKRELDFRGIVSAREEGAERNARPFRLVGNGTMNGQPFRFDVHGASLMSTRRDAAYPFEASLTAGTTRVAMRGSLPKPFDLGYMNAGFKMAGTDMADLYYLSGLAFPNTRPFRMTGQLSRKGTVVSFIGLTGTIGDSDMRGDVSVDLAHLRPQVHAAVTSKALDLDDAATWFGGGRGRKQHAKPAAHDDDRIFPDAKLRAARVRSTDVQLNYQAAEVHSAHLPIRAMSLTLNMTDGVMKFDPVAVSLPAGAIKGTVSIDAREDTVRTEVDARLFDVQLSQFKRKKSPDAPPFEGALQGRVQLTGRGNSVRQFMAASNGTATFVVPHGEVRDSLAEMSSVNLSRGLGLMFAKDQDKTSVRCGVANLKDVAGTLQVQSLVFDTRNVLVTGKGNIDLKTERYDLEIRGHPKKLRLFRVKSPVAIRGPLLKPELSIDPDGKVLEQGGIAAALAAVAGPLGAVVAFVDPGLAKDADCSSLLQEAKSAGTPVKTAEIQGVPGH